MRLSSLSSTSKTVFPFAVIDSTKWIGREEAGGAAAAGLWAAARGSRLGTDGLGPRWVAGWEEKRSWAASGFPGFNWVVQGGPSAGFGLGFGPSWVWGFGFLSISNSTQV